MVGGSQNQNYTDPKYLETVPKIIKSSPHEPRGLIKCSLFPHITDTLSEQPSGAVMIQRLAQGHFGMPSNQWPSVSINLWLFMGLNTHGQAGILSSAQTE